MRPRFYHFLSYKCWENLAPKLVLVLFETNKMLHRSYEVGNSIIPTYHNLCKIQLSELTRVVSTFQLKLNQVESIEFKSLQS